MREEEGASCRSEERLIEAFRRTGIGAVQLGDEFKGRYTAMIIFRIGMTVLPEKQKEVLQTLLLLIHPPREEQGCVSYDVFGDIENKHVFNLISQWETRRHLDQHLQTDRLSVLLGTKCLLSEPLRIQIATVSGSEGMEAVSSARKRGA